MDLDIFNTISFLKDIKIKQFDENADTIDIIRSFLDETDSEEAFFIVDLTKIIDQYKSWKEKLPDIVPYYAVKCNPNEVIINLLSKLGVNFDCASKNEIATILNQDIKANRIIYANPNRSDSHIKYARSNDVDLLTVDSEMEMYKLKVNHPKANLLIRIKVDDSKSECKFSCKFGASISEAEKLCDIAEKIKLKIVGVAFHIGSNCRDANMYYGAIKNAKEVFEIGRKHNFDMQYLDIGGGLPGFYQDGELQFKDYAIVIKNAIKELFPPEYINPSKLKLIAELGRFFVASSHTLVLSVINKKEKVDEITGEKHFIYYMNDGVYNSFGNITYDHAKPILLPYNERDGELYNATVYGYTCDQLDKIAPTCPTQPCKLPDLACGEFIYIENMGAYTTASASTFNSFPHTKCKYIFRK
jgi:ornithine decarboxylase